MKNIIKIELQDRDMDWDSAAEIYVKKTADIQNKLDELGKYIENSEWECTEDILDYIYKNFEQTEYEEIETYSFGI